MRIERELNFLTESELKIELANHKKFEILNDEKITAHFMSLVKNDYKSESVTLIKNNNGEAFRNLDDLNTYVGNYFKEIYKRDLTTVEVLDSSRIEDFLGREILQRPEVANAKLSNEEKVELDLPLSLEELEQSMNKANMKSAPGANGISNRFIRKFWDLLKYGLLRYANYAFETGRLTNSFRTANIKLIPKKGGDLSQIKNWRPISLLNTFYKTISRAFAERLKKYMNKLTPCAQKGYANNRYCQEVLIGVVKTVEKCKFFNRKGAVLCLDVKKAFDSLSHSYMKNIFTFFNFGPNISRWLTILSMNRAARIVIDNDTCTDIFELHCKKKPHFLSSAPDFCGS